LNTVHPCNCALMPRLVKPVFRILLQRVRHLIDNKSLGTVLKIIILLGNYNLD
jgi:hypothetical protein